MLGALNGTPSAPPTSQGSGTGGGAGIGPRHWQRTGRWLGSGAGLGRWYRRRRLSARQRGDATRSCSTRPSRSTRPTPCAPSCRARSGCRPWSCPTAPPPTSGWFDRSTSAFGLDQEAVKAVRQWRFRPGMRLGEPVPVQISVARLVQSPLTLARRPPAGASPLSHSRVAGSGRRLLHRRFVAGVRASRASAREAPIIEHDGTRKRRARSEVVGPHRRILATGRGPPPAQWRECAPVGDERGGKGMSAAAGESRAAK